MTWLFQPFKAVPSWNCCDLSEFLSNFSLPVAVSEMGYTHENIYSNEKHCDSTSEFGGFPLNFQVNPWPSIFGTQVKVSGPAIMHDFRSVQILKITSHECLSRLDPKFENLILDKVIRYCWLMLVVSPYPVSHYIYISPCLASTSVFGSNPQILDNGLLKSLFIVEI